MFEDKTLNCRECGKDFVFSASEQEFYAAKGFQNEPSRCPDCRAARKQYRNNRGTQSRQNREMYDAVCARCGQACQVPFRPSNTRPVYCKDCYQLKARTY